MYSETKTNCPARIIQQKPENKKYDAQFFTLASAASLLLESASFLLGAATLMLNTATFVLNAATILLIPASLMAGAAFLSAVAASFMVVAIEVQTAVISTTDFIGAGRFNKQVVSTSSTTLH